MSSLLREPDLAHPVIPGREQDGFGGITDQIRGNGWVIRSRGLAASLSPDGSPEKRYFYELVEDAVAYWEGQRGIADPAMSTHPNYVWAAQNSNKTGRRSASGAATPTHASSRCGWTTSS